MAKKKTTQLADTAVETIRHKDKRKNIPTEELRDLYRDEPGKMLYPRDPSLDPQLVWKGKDDHGRRILFRGKTEDQAFQDFGGEAGAVALAANIVFNGSVLRQDGHYQAA
jgi:hypothetical protein